MVGVRVGSWVVHCVYKSPQKDTRKYKDICELHTHKANSATRGLQQCCIKKEDAALDRR